MRRLIYPALCASLVALGACSTERAASEDPYAGLDEAIRVWRTDLVASSACPAPGPDAQVAGPGAAEGCRAFSVACKVEAELTEAEAAEGVAAKALTAMRWEAWNPNDQEFRQTSAAAEFVRTGETWERTEAAPVNLSTCSPLTPP